MDRNGKQHESFLGIQIADRLRQLGMSRRELSRRVQLSRQTLHLLEHEPERNFADFTFEQLDIGLKWEYGTARAFWVGEIKSRHRGENMDEQVSAYLRKILRRLETMDIDQLEREVIFLEEEAYDLDTRNHPSTEIIGRMISRLLAALADEEGRDDGGGNFA